MKKQHILYLAAGIVFLILIAGGWYAYKFRECVKKVSYVSPREQQGAPGGGFSGLRYIADKGDYYRFDFQEFRTSEDAIRACMWK